MTTAGTATRYELISYIYEPDYEPDDPRKWRDKCEDVTMRLKDYLEMWKEKWMSLTWLCVPEETWTRLWYHSPKEGYIDEEGAQVGLYYLFIDDPYSRIGGLWGVFG